MEALVLRTLSILLQPTQNYVLVSFYLSLSQVNHCGMNLIFPLIYCCFHKLAKMNLNGKFDDLLTSRSLLNEAMWWASFSEGTIAKLAFCLLL